MPSASDSWWMILSIRLFGGTGSAIGGRLEEPVSRSHRSRCAVYHWQGLAGLGYLNISGGTTPTYGVVAVWTKR